MEIIAVTSQKGGVGKTTLVMNLAIAAGLDGLPTIVFDTDPQASAAAWHDRRKASGHPDQPMVISVQPSRLAPALKDAIADGYKLAIIDTPPNVTGDAVHISKAGDLVLVPVHPSALDLEAIQATLNITTMSGRPAVAVLNECKPFGNLTEDARALITDTYQFPVAPQTIGDRTAFVHSASTGQGVVETEPSSKAAQEIGALWKWVKTALRDSRRAEAAKERKAANG